MSSSPASTLCQRCGLCCDGTLFTHVPLKASEAAPMQALGMTVRHRGDGTPVMLQGCDGLAGSRCTVYDQRPEGCRRYACHLLTALDEGEVSLPEALAVVDGAHERLAAEPDERQPSPELKHYLDVHFRGRNRRYSEQ